MNQGRKMCTAGLAAAVFLAFGGQAIAAEQLLGSWCDDTGYRIDLSADRITFRDRQYGDPPDGSELAFGDGIAVYRQDFRHTRWPQIDVLDCTLRLTAPDGAEETCRGPGYGYVPQFNLKRCPADVIS